MCVFMYTEAGDRHEMSFFNVFLLLIFENIVKLQHFPFSFIHLNPLLYVSGLFFFKLIIPFFTTCYCMHIYIPKYFIFIILNIIYVYIPKYI